MPLPVHPPSPRSSLNRLSRVAQARTFQPTITALCQDKSWRVRYMTADKFCAVRAAPSLFTLCCTALTPPFSLQMCEAVTDGAVGAPGSVVLDSKDPATEVLVDGFVRLLTDSEAEVRTAAASRVGDTARLFGADVTLRKLLGPIGALAKDQSQYARASLASVITSLASVLKKKDVLEQCLPLFLTLLKDQTPDVRLNIISKLEAVHTVRESGRGDEDRARGPNR
jgi:serine/threonine-protein phosphatase 2A regulatory subunit A